MATAFLLFLGVLLAIAADTSDCGCGYDSSTNQTEPCGSHTEQLQWQINQPRSALITIDFCFSPQFWEAKTQQSVQVLQLVANNYSLLKSFNSSSTRTNRAQLKSTSSAIIQFDGVLPPLFSATASTAIGCGNVACLKDPMVLDISDVVILGLRLMAAILVGITGFLVVLTLLLSRKVEILQYQMNCFALLGAMLLYICIFFMNAAEADETEFVQTCQLRTTLLCIGFTLGFGSLLIKALQARQLCHPSVKAPQLKLRHTCFILAGFLTIDLILILVMYFAVPCTRSVSQVTLLDEAFAGSGKYVIEYGCSWGSSSWLGVLLAYKIGMVLVALWISCEISLQPRDENSPFGALLNDVGRLGTVTINIFIAAAIFTPFLFLDRLPETITVVTSVLILLTVANCTLVVFIPGLIAGLRAIGQEDFSWKQIFGWDSSGAKGLLPKPDNAWLRKPGDRMGPTQGAGIKGVQPDSEQTIVNQHVFTDDAQITARVDDFCREVLLAGMKALRSSPNLDPEVRAELQAFDAMTAFEWNKIALTSTLDYYSILQLRTAFEISREDMNQPEPSLKKPFAPVNILKLEKIFGHEFVQDTRPRCVSDSRRMEILAHMPSEMRSRSSSSLRTAHLDSIDKRSSARNVLLTNMQTLPAVSNRIFAGAHKTRKSLEPKYVPEYLDPGFFDKDSFSDEHSHTKVAFYDHMAKLVLSEPVEDQKTPVSQTQAAPESEDAARTPEMFEAFRKHSFKGHSDLSAVETRSRRSSANVRNSANSNGTTSTFPRSPEPDSSSSRHVSSGSEFREQTQNFDPELGGITERESVVENGHISGNYRSNSSDNAGDRNSGSNSADNGGNSNNSSSSGSNSSSGNSSSSSSSSSSGGGSSSSGSSGTSGEMSSIDTGGNRSRTTVNSAGSNSCSGNGGHEGRRSRSSSEGRSCGSCGNGSGSGGSNSGDNSESGRGNDSGHSPVSNNESRFGFRNGSLRIINAGADGKKPFFVSLPFRSNRASSNSSVPQNRGLHIVRGHSKLALNTERGPDAEHSKREPLTPLSVAITATPVTSNSSLSSPSTPLSSSIPSLVSLPFSPASPSITSPPSSPPLGALSSPPAVIIRRSFSTQTIKHIPAPTRPPPRTPNHADAMKS